MAIDQGKLTQGYVFSAQGTISELSADLDEAASLDAKHKAKVRLIRWGALAAFLVFLIMSIAVSPVLFLFVVIIPIGMLIYSVRISNRGVQAERVTFLRLLLKSLGQDAGERRRMKVNLCLCKDRKKISEGPSPRRKGDTLTLYRDSWLTLNGRLGDGTAVYESCTDIIRERARRNARGKIKSKERRFCLLSVHLDYDPAVYGDASAASRTLNDPFRLPAGATMKSALFTPKALTMKTIMKGDVSPQSILTVTEAMLLGAYRVLNLSRKTAVGGVK